MADILILDSNERWIDTYIAIWLQGKQGRSGSTGTLRAYNEIITHFRAALRSRGLDLDGNRAILQTVAQGWAALPWRADFAEQGVQVSNATYNKRLAALS